MGLLGGQGLQKGPQPTCPRRLAWNLGSLGWKGSRGGKAAGRGSVLPLFSQDANGEGCQCSHCLHFFCVSSWHPGHPGFWTGSQALHAAPVFTWDKKPSQRGLEKRSPPACLPTHPRPVLRLNISGQGPRVASVSSIWGQFSHLPLPQDTTFLDLAPTTLTK